MSAGRLLRWGCGVALALALVGAMAWALRPRPRVDWVRFDWLASRGRYDSAEKLVDAYLKRVPGDSEAHFRQAQLLIEVPRRGEADEETVARATRVLGHLDQVRPSTRGQEALVRLYQGKALYILRRWREVEQRMREALALDPVIPEAGWFLLELYYLQGRSREAAELALQLHASEPDPRDRVQLLLELLRQDAQPPDPASLVLLFEPVVRADPEDVWSIAALGLAEVRSSKAEDGLRRLQGRVTSHPEDPVARWALLTGLELAGRLPDLEKALAEIPAGMADDPRFARFRGRVAHERQDWPASIAAYRQAVSFEPSDRSLIYRLAQALRLGGETEAATDWFGRYDTYSRALPQVRPLYEEADRVLAFGPASELTLYGRLEALRAAMQKPEEAAAWHALALNAPPPRPRASLEVPGAPSGGLASPPPVAP